MTQVAVPAMRDSYVNAVAPDSNYGASSLIAMGVLILGGSKGQVNRPIANFDISAVPASAVILGAKMRRNITVVDASGHACSILRCTRPAQWTENGVTWNKYDGMTAWTAGGGDYDAVTPTPVSYNEPLAAGDHEIPGLDGFVRDAIALRGGIVSLIMKNDNEAPSVSQRSFWYSGSSWQLVIEYEAARAAGDRMSFGSRRPRAPARAARPSRPRRPARPSSMSGGST